MSSSLQRKQLLTLAYTQQFSYPLTPFELYIRLFSSSYISVKYFVSQLQALIDSNFVVYSQGFLFLSFLSTAKINKLITIRKQRSVYSTKKWREAYSFIQFAKHIPFISGIAVTGSLSVDNAVINDDVDFLIITDKRRLWITRLIVVLFASYLGKRRSFAQEEKNSWCFNLWIEESNIALPRSSRSIYEAVEVSQAVWLYSKNSINSLFYTTNSWVKKNIYFYKSISALRYKKLVKSYDANQRIMGISNALDVLNYISYLFQYAYMKHHITREKVGLTHAFFHPRDTKKLIFSRWKTAVLRLVK